MELYLNVLMGLGIFWVGFFSYSACHGCRFGFDTKKPRQLRKIIIKPITKVVMLSGGLIIVHSLLKMGIDFLDLPLALPFTLIVGLGFLGGLAIGIWDVRKNDVFLRNLQKIIAYPTCMTLFISSFYFIGISLFKILNE